jgi:hypothetical protein
LLLSLVVTLGIILLRNVGGGGDAYPRVPGRAERITPLSHRDGGGSGRRRPVVLLQQARALAAVVAAATTTRPQVHAVKRGA